MRLAVVLFLGLPLLWGQTCVPSRMQPVGSVAGILGSESCRLSDETAYAAYRLDLPVRGRIEMSLSSPDADLMLILRSAGGTKLDSGAAISRPVEAGSYTLLVNGRTPGQLGSYSVTTGFSAEPGLLCSNFPSAGLNQTITGTLGASGCRLPNGQPYEAYTLNTLGSGTLTVAASSAEFSPIVIVRASDGAVVSAGATAAAAVSADSRYEVVIYSSGNTGKYQISTSFALADDETCRPLKMLAEADNDSATVGIDSCTTTNPAGDLAYFNYYNLTVTETGVAQIVASSNDFTPTLNILDDSGNLVATDSGSGGTAISEIRMPLKPGAYLVQVISTIPAGGAYRLTYGFTSGPPQPCRPATGSFGGAQPGRLSRFSCRTNFGLADLYGFTLPSAGTVDFTLSTSNFTSALVLRDVKDNLMVLDEDRQALGESHVSADLPAGSYTVAAAARYDSGEYQLAAAFSAHEIPPCTYVQALDINGGYIQRLGARSCRDANGQPVDYYEFILPSDSVVAAVMTSSEVDGHLTLTDVSGSVLRSDDNSYGFQDPLIVQYLPAGTYRAEARAATSTPGGYYQVDLRTIPSARPAFCAPKAKLDLGATITGTIQFTGCPYHGAFADIYEFRITEATAVDVRLTSAEFDASLVLLDEQGSVVAEDDNSGGGSDARISDVLAAGTYYVVAKPAAEYYSAGGYALSLGQGQ